MNNALDPQRGRQLLSTSLNQVSTWEILAFSSNQQIEKRVHSVIGKDVASEFSMIWADVNDI